MPISCMHYFMHAHMCAAMSRLITIWGDWPRPGGRTNNGIVLFVQPPPGALLVGLEPRPPNTHQIPIPWELGVDWAGFLCRVLSPEDAARALAPLAVHVPLPLRWA